MGTDVTLKFNMPDFDGEARKKMAEAVQVVRTQVLETLSGSRKADPSRIYYVPGTRRKYQASSPGQPPATATAELRQNIKTAVKGEGKTVVGRVGTDKIQGLMTEFGTKNMAARPWLRISFEKATDKVKSILGSKWF